MRVTINRQTLAILRAFGDINTNTDKILDYINSNNIDLTTLPKTPIVDPVKTTINVTNAPYIALVEMMGARCNTISLARIIEWFIGNEMYVQLGWTMVSEPHTIRENAKQIDKIRELKRAVYAFASVSNDEDNDEIAHILVQVKQLEDRYGI